MDYPPLLNLADEEAYRHHFEAEYCVSPLPTFDGISVRFRKRVFYHAFFESSSSWKKDDQFSTARAERMDWIKTALSDPKADLRYGYDSKKRCEARDRRVVIVKGNFIIVIRLIDDKRAEFVTCFVATTRAVQQIRRSRKWPRREM